MNVINGGVTPAPAPTPAKISPFATPRSPVGIQAATSRFEAGNTIPSPTPSRNRAASSTIKLPEMPAGTAATSAVNTAHQIAARARILRGPKRSAKRPPGA